MKGNVKFPNQTLTRLKGGKKEMIGKMMGGGIHKMMGIKALVLGVLILTNVYWLELSWPVFIGGILVLGGVVKLLMPCGKHRGK